MAPHIERRRIAFVGLLLANSAIIFAFKGADFLYLTSVFLHLMLGLVALAVFILSVRRWLGRLFADDDTFATGVGAAALIVAATCLATGTYLLMFGATLPFRNVLRLHLASAALAVLLGSLYFIRRATTTADLAFRSRSRASAYATTLCVFLPALIVTARAAIPTRETNIANPRWAPLSPEGEGDGKGGKFYPSSVQTVNNIFFPSEYYMDSQSCGAKGCHPDVYAQWKSSAHHFSSFNNQWYRKSVEYMQEVNGVPSSKWCGGCHDMAVLQTAKPGTGKSRMDFPIKDQVWPPEQYPESHAGIGCAACHSIVHVKSTMGQGDFRADYPAMHKYAISKNPFMKFMHDFLIRRAPEPHKKTFLKSFHRNDTAKFCSSCHKVHLDVPVNNYRWFRGFNDYDAWQNSGVSGGNARAFYYPKDSYKKCADCHMPKVRSNDAANKDGFVKSHRFPAANTALPFVNQDKQQFEVVKNFLQGIQPDGKREPVVTVDVFAIRRQSHASRTGKLREIPNPKSEIRNPKSVAGRESSMLPGESGVGEGTGTLVARTSDWGDPELIDGTVAVKPGETVLVEVVARTRKVGHFFPGGTVDAFDAWLELEGKDESGRLVFHSGGLEYPNGPLAKDSHEYRSLLLDAHGNRINKRNAWAARSAVYARLIPPGAADTAHFRFTAPRAVKGSVTFTARMNYRKFDWWNTQFAFAGKPKNEPEFAGAGLHDRSRSEPLVTKHYDDRKWSFTGDTSRVSGKVKAIPNLPIITLHEDTKAIAVGNPQSSILNPQYPLKERWNDYGIGLYLQKDFRTAERAFERVIALDPQWPEGYVNAARVRHDEGDLTGAIDMLKKALVLSPRLAKAHYFFGSSLFQVGDYDEALKHLYIVTKQFPEDRVVRNLIGVIHFRHEDYDLALAEFERTVQIDPEDLQAHYHLMLCYRGKGELSNSLREEKLYKRFKADETATRIVGPYLQKHPADNNEARLIHEHEG